MAELKLKVVPSLEKCFLDEKIEDKYELKHISMLKNERLSFQLAHTFIYDGRSEALYGKLEITGGLKDKISVKTVESVPVVIPAYHWTVDDGYLRRTPGLYPDLLVPYSSKYPFIVAVNQLRANYITIEDKNGLEPGEYELTFRVYGDKWDESVSLKITVIDAELPKQDFIYTQWFHCDSIATVYNCRVFSKRHWTLIGNFMEAAVRCGVNSMFTPVLTPPIDTSDGYERPTVQLVDVYKNGGEYSFGYEKLDRYMDMALERGMEYFEISHFYAQKGPTWPPKVMAYVDGKYKKIFGNKENAAGDEYRAFLRAFVSGLVEHLKARGLDRRCIFHISDEPRLDKLEKYLAARCAIADILEGYTVMDALFDYEMYERGAVTTPIPGVHAIEPFLEHKVPNLWAYTCCGDHTDVSNRFYSMPGQRTRIMGTQLYKFGLVGFAQWGFNYWNRRGLGISLNPFIDTCGEYFVQAGDAYVVYPGNDGKALYSLHGEHFFEGLQDMRAMKLLESKIGHGAVVELIEEGCDEPVTFKKYPRTIQYMLGMRERINRAISEKTASAN